MDGSVGLVFSWNPKTRVWVRERGPEDALLPPAPPIDDGAVQTYFLDPANGRWTATILGPRARMIAAQIEGAYRSPMVAGLAYDEPVAKPRFVVQTYDTTSRSRSTLRMIAAISVLIVLIGGGAVAANTMLTASPGADATAAPTAAATTDTTAKPATVAEAAATTAATATQAPAAVSVPAATTGTSRTQAPVRTPAPTVAPITIVSYSTRLTNGTTITFTGPDAVLQGTGFDATFRATSAAGQPVFDNLTMYFGALGTAQAVTISADGTGLYATSIRVNVPKGDQLLSVKLGNNGEVRTLGTIAVR